MRSSMKEAWRNMCVKRVIGEERSERDSMQCGAHVHEVDKSMLTTLTEHHRCMS